ncbi:MAG: hypothetical protein LBM23_09350 [Propionibacteriaceae bacterium]|jgi:hypothetical protein|nr:hypothetical protein [Propionibacteriaceae bacterium]
MSERTVLFIDANTLATPVTRTILITGAGADGMRWTWSSHVEEEADRHARGDSTKTSTVRTTILKSELSPTARTTRGLKTRSVKDRQVIADAIKAGARYLITTDVDDFDFDDLAAHGMNAVNADHFMAQRFSEDAYRESVELLSQIQKNPGRTPAEVHRMLGRRHPRLATRFSYLYGTLPVDADPDQPSVIFRGISCIRCDNHLGNEEGMQVGLCAEHFATN